MLLNQYGQRSCPPMIYIMYLKKLLQSKKIYISRITDKCITPVLTVDKSTKALLIENVLFVMLNMFVTPAIVLVDPLPKDSYNSPRRIINQHYHHRHHHTKFLIFLYTNQCVFHKEFDLGRSHYYRPLYIYINN